MKVKYRDAYEKKFQNYEFLLSSPKNQKVRPKQENQRNYVAE